MDGDVTPVSGKRRVMPGMMTNACHPLMVVRPGARRLFDLPSKLVVVSWPGMIKPRHVSTSSSIENGCLAVLMPNGRGRPGLCGQRYGMDAGSPHDRELSCGWRVEGPARYDRLHPST